MDIVGILVIVGIGYLVWKTLRLLGRIFRFFSTYKVPLTGRIPPSGRCDYHIVGESHYQKALKKVLRRYGRGEEKPLTAYIITEPDNPYDENACAVYIDGMKVGHLPRDDAAYYVRQMKKKGVPRVSRFQTCARLIGGESGKPNIGVMLDLPTEDDE